MRIHTNDFKNAIKQFGREINAKIIYTLNNEEIIISGEDLNSVNFHYQGAILKSVMKQLDIDSNVDIPQNTLLNAQFGVKVGNQYEYITFGNFVVYKSEKQEDTNSYKITCYDKMLYSMIDYNNSNITYPITIRDYINAICNKLGLTFANVNDTFVNYDKTIASKLYIDTDGNSLDYTFRDVLDELAQVTASTICINDNDELEIRYINDTNDTIDEEFFKDINVNFGEEFKPVNTIVFSRSGGVDKIALSSPSDLADNLKNAITIEDNQILNGDNRGDFLQAILNQLYGFQYYINDFSSPGICYYDLCDRYNVSIGENTYSCVMLNDEINITQGLEENIYTDIPEEKETDYTTTTKDDRGKSRTSLTLDKVNREIKSIIQLTDDLPTKTEVTNEISQKITDNNNAYVNVELNKKVNNNDVTKAYLMLKLTNDRSSTALGADEISLSANDVLNLLSGGTINLSGKNISISSNNFSVDTNGYVTMYGATVNGKIKGSQFTGNNENVRLQIGSQYDAYMSTDNSLEFLYNSDNSLIIGIYQKRTALGNITYFNTSSLGYSFIGKVQGAEADFTNLKTERISANNIQCGESTANSSYWVRVDFPIAFPYRPYVVVTPNTGTAGVIALKTASVGTTGFSVIVGGSVSGNIDFQWIAMI